MMLTEVVPPRGMGWIPDLPDPRDLRYSLAQAVPLPSKLPAIVDLRRPHVFPPIWDQGQIGSCTGQGTARMLSYIEACEGNGAEVLSRLMLYYDARIVEHSTGSDSGAQIRDVIKQVAKRGVSLETLWPYDETKVLHAPGTEAVEEGLHRSKGFEYSRLDSLADMLHCLASGYPFVFGATLFESFRMVSAANHAVVPMPAFYERMLGGHCMCAVGYSQKTKTILVANSWGESWGDAGYCRFPFAYLGDGDLASDFWTVRKIAR
jgi:C1A family cysteine protease